MDMLKVNKELDMDISINSRENPSYSEQDDNSNGNTRSQVMDVFDVLLAGVEADD